MHKLLLFMKRRPGMTAAEFRTYYEERHVPLCMTYMRGSRAYRRHYLESGPHNPDDIDVITELRFDDRAVLDIVTATLARDGMPADVIADELNLFDRPALRWAVVDTCETKVGG